MISQKVRNALKQLHEQISPNAPESTGDCWAEFIGAVIEITRQNVTQTLTAPTAGHVLFSKDQIIARALWDNDFDLEDFGLSLSE